MESVGDRIKNIRKHSNLTLEKFGYKIGIGKSALSQFESGKANPSDRTLLAICREFNVNETWLRTGEGTMFIEPGRDEAIEQFFADVLRDDPDEFRHRFVSALCRLDVEKWKKAEEFINTLLSAGAQQEALPAAQGPAHEMTEAEMHAEIHRQFELERRAGAGSAASGSGSSGTATA